MHFFSSLSLLSCELFEQSRGGGVPVTSKSQSESLSSVSDAWIEFVVLSSGLLGASRAVSGKMELIENDDFNGVRAIVGITKIVSSLFTIFT